MPEQLFAEDVLGERREGRRVATPKLDLRLHGATYSTVNWSLKGFLVAPYDGPSGPGDKIAIHIVVRLGKETVTYVAEAEVVRISTVKKQLAARFVRMESEATKTLERLLEQST